MAEREKLKKVALDIAIERLKAQIAKDKVNNSGDWKKAYLHKVDIHNQSLNRSEQCLN